MFPTPEKYQRFFDLIRQGVALVDIAVELEVSVYDLNRWRVAFDGPGPADLVVENKDGAVTVEVAGVKVVSGDPSVASSRDATDLDVELARAMALPRTFLARRIRRGRYDHLLEHIRRSEISGRNSRKVIAALAERAEHRV